MQEWAAALLLLVGWWSFSQLNKSCWMTLKKELEELGHFKDA
jgi:hypothetical protein